MIEQFTASDLGGFPVRLYKDDVYSSLYFQVDPQCYKTDRFSSKLYNLTRFQIEAIEKERIIGWYTESRSTSRI